MARQTEKGAAAGAAVERLEDRALSRVLHHSTAQAVAKHLDLHTVGELLEHFPRRYLSRGQLTSFDELELGQEASIISRVVSVSTRSLHTRRGSIAEVLVTDQLEPSAQPLLPVPDAVPAPGGPRLDALAHAPAPDAASSSPGATMSLTFFNAFTAAKDLTPGDHVLFSGKVSEFRGRLTLTNPHYAVLSDLAAAGDPDEVPPPIPVYPAGAKFMTDRVSAAVAAMLSKVDLGECEDPVPADLRRSYRLMPAARAYEAIHRPRDEEEHHRALRYFRFREALVLQTVLARRAAALGRLHAPRFAPRSGGWLERFDAALPYALTGGQRRIGEEVAADLAADRPMNRLLQGDVGSGKTLVALRAMLQVADGGGQSALLAPTEVLASQHHRSIVSALGELAAPEGGLFEAEGVGVVLLTASMPAARRREALARIASGAAQIVIGTHALLGEKVSFADLGLAVVDEQHRFGVNQRHALGASEGTVPHQLVMTATPIPRSVAMTVFGDLAVSVLDEMPPGRQEVTTHVVSLAEHPAWEGRLWRRAREEVDAGHAVFVVVPSIGGEGNGGSGSRSRAGGESGQLQSVEGLSAALAAQPALRGVEVGELHGRMDAEAKARVMDRMVGGELRLLVATTVIEVGVDVPDATLMIIMDADRLGISTLHQLRGRIGRGSLPGTCLLVTEQDAQGASRPRLDAVASTRDGFELSRLDLEQRREGDILGSSQSGSRSTLKNLSVLKHPEIIEAARQDARRLVAEDPSLRAWPDLARAAARVGADEQTEYLYQG
ncbi:ATP-dependent DNA helicase RecG [Rothia sp. AR01]|uniref:ATP-dependent DNA helicase RecG n=1 Tax=Rothia santali TaxID=2949643 RepID=A0A9X2HGD7_9MICC|nr:ATP-dependent DNA helicase RecG [Rothia santali]MCP3426257.1 ATP-dependent DNA helicase RecG [Rothia santali]